MSHRQQVLDEMIECRSRLFNFALKLSGNIDRAEDLVQDTYVNAIKSIDMYQPGTKMAAWLFTILRNRFRSEYRTAKRRVEDPDGVYEARLFTRPSQIDTLLWRDFVAALDRLPQEQNEALVLVGLHGVSYEDAAVICQAPIGTMKSRLHRARQKLLEHFPEGDKLLLASTASGEGPGSTWR